MKIRFSARARADLQEILDYISSDSEIFAERTVEQLIQVARNLARFPESGRISNRFNDPQFREWIHRNYRVAYRIGEDVIEIITIHHTSQHVKDD